MSGKHRERPRKKTEQKRGSKNLAWILAVGVLVGFGVLATEPLWNAAQTSAMHDDPGLIAQGEPLYVKNCQVCHGVRGVGQDLAQRNGGQRPDGSYIAPALDASAHAWHHPDDVLFRLIKDGSPASDSPMRGWAHLMSDKDIHAVIAYFQSLWPEDLRRRYRQNPGQH
ncbi:MAG: cytochrome c [Deltaproteobacteria bacterium]|nr:cytochrome c [Deltaproteobacteria bacterium]